SWYRGPHLLGLLEDIDVEDDRSGGPFRMAVQWVNRPHLDFRGFSGRVAGGAVRPGDEAVVAGSGRVSRIERIVLGGADLTQATAGDSVTLVFADDVDIARGDLLADPKRRPE